VVFGYVLALADTSAVRPDSLHRELRWWRKAELVASPEVRANTKAYFP
jgi:hypothetical protein